MNNQGSVKVSALFTPKEVVCRLKGVSLHECIRMLVKRLKKSGAIPDEAAALRAVIDREALGGTIVAPGLTVPHARLEKLARPAVAMATSADGIELPAGKGERAHLIVLILTNIAAPGEYLEVLAGVARAFSEEKLIRGVTRLPTPEQVWEFFDKGAGVLPAFVTAADIMATSFTALRHIDTLATAIDHFCQHEVTEIPVLDEDGDLVGVVAEEAILKLSLPEYILWLDDLRPMLHFEPFGETLKDEHVTRLAEIMSKRFVIVEEETPAIQVARELMRTEVKQVFVVRGKKLIGVITLSNFLKRVFRG